MEFLVRDYIKEEEAAALSRTHTKWHPLATENKLSHGERKKTLEAAFEDPLRILTSQVTNEQPDRVSKAYKRKMKYTADMQVETAIKEWDAYKTSITQRFSSVGNITVSTLLNVISKETKGRGKSITAMHMDDLEDPEHETREKVKVITQQEYVVCLKELDDDIAQAWSNNERVAALKLSIKVAKLLSDTSVPLFYPTLFVLVTNVMDTVGNLVWNRIKRKAEVDDLGNTVELPSEFTCNNIRPDAMETCRNWFYKIGSVRELLPRIYLETAILRCLRFLQKDPPLSAFERLSMMIRGIGDPLAAGYARLYLARQMHALVPFNTTILVDGISDYLRVFRRVLHGDFDEKLSDLQVQRQSYITLIEPVFEWTLHCIFQHADEEVIINVTKAFIGPHEQHTDIKEAPIGILLHYVIKKLPPAFVAHHAVELCRVIKRSEDISIRRHLNFVLLGVKLCEHPPPDDSRLQVLNDVWKVVTKYQNLEDYLSVASTFTDYILQFCSDRELLVMLKDIKQHVKNSRVDDAALSILESIIFKLVTHYNDLDEVFALESLVDILDVFYGDMRINVYKRLLGVLARNNRRMYDPMMRHFCFELAKILHDSLDSLSSDDDRRQITLLVVRFVQKVDFGQDVEKHLSFLLECRATFTSMDLLKETIAHASNRLAIMKLKAIAGLHTKYTKEFVKACISFNEITIPCMSNAVTRAYLLLETAEVALLNGLLNHMEGLLKSSITCIQEIQEDVRDTMSYDVNALVGFIKKVSSFLIVVPGNPELGAFYLVRGLLNLLGNDRLRLVVHGRAKVQILFGVCAMLCAMSQSQLPYHVSNQWVDENDLIYFGSPDYREDILSISSETVQSVMDTLDQTNDQVEQEKQILDACNAFLSIYKVTEKTRETLTKLAQRTRFSKESSKYLMSTMKYSKRKGITLPVNQ